MTFEEIQRAINNYLVKPPQPGEITLLIQDMQQYLSNHTGPNEIGQRSWVGIKNALMALTSKKMKDKLPEALMMAKALLIGAKSNRGLPFTKKEERLFENEYWSLEGLIKPGAPGIAARIQWQLKTKGPHSAVLTNFTRQEDAVSIIE